MVLSPSILKEIIIEVASGESIRRVLDKHNINQYDFYEYLAENPSQQALYDKAQIYKAHGLVDDTIDIADNEIDHVRARNKIATRQWFAAKIYPSRYSDRIDINLKTIDITQTLLDAQARVAMASRSIEPQESVESDINIDGASSSDLLPMRYLENAPHQQPVDITKQNSIGASGYKPEIPTISNTSDPKKSEDDDIFS
jgi:hypothetical protein